MNRRNFLKMVGISSGVVVAPGIVSGGVLMPVRPKAVISGFAPYVPRGAGKIVESIDVYSELDYQFVQNAIRFQLDWSAYDYDH